MESKVPNAGNGIIKSIYFGSLLSQIQSNAKQHSTAQQSTAQNSTAQQNKAQHSTAQHTNKQNIKQKIQNKNKNIHTKLRQYRPLEK